jgi:hypothetical protein
VPAPARFYPPAAISNQVLYGSIHGFDRSGIIDPLRYVAAKGLQVFPKAACAVVDLDHLKTLVPPLNLAERISHYPAPMHLTQRALPRFHANQGVDPA